MKKQLKVLSLAIVLVLVAVFSPLGTNVAMAAELSKHNYEIATRETEGMVIGKLGEGYDKLDNYCYWELSQGNVTHSPRSDSAAWVYPKGDGWTGDVQIKRCWFKSLASRVTSTEYFNVNVYDTTTLCFRFKREGGTFVESDKFTRFAPVTAANINDKVSEATGLLNTHITKNITPTEGEYTFDGNWYEDEACTVPVDTANFWKKSSRNYYGIIKKAETLPEAEITLAVYAEDKTYEHDGAEHVYDGRVTVQVGGVDATEGVTLEYKEGKGEWTTELPKITDVGRKNLLVRAKYDGATSSEHGFFMEVTERKPVVSTADVTFKVVNGTWNGTDSADKIVTVTLTDGKGTLPAGEIPTGMTANEGYDNNSGAWNAEISSEVTGAATYTYTFDPQQQEQNPPIIIPYTPVVIEDDETPLEEDIQDEEVIEDEETPLAEEVIEDEETPLAEEVIDDEATPLAETSDVPKTGDATNIPMWIALLFVSVLGFTGTAYSTKRKEK